MANSKLAKWKWGGKTDHFNERDHKIDTITIHHMAGDLTLDGCCTSVQGRGGSCNYCIDSSGNIGVMIDEKYRSWCSCSPSNDTKSVNIEVANCSGAPDWRVSDKAMTALTPVIFNGGHHAPKGYIATFNQYALIECDLNIGGRSYISDGVGVLSD